MDDLSLEELQAALQTVQERKSTTRLSDRNVVELVSKLQELGLLPSDLLHSISGKEYLTQQQLRKEVQQAVAQAGGRFAVTDLPAQLGVDLAHCERQAQQAVEQSGGSMQIVQGEIITRGYFDGLAAEVDELLQESGVVAMSDMARRFKLGSELLLSAITARLGTIVHGRLESGILYTAAYIARIKAQLRGALRGALCPVNLTALSKQLDLQATSSASKTVTGLVEELIAEGAIFGSLKAGMGTFTPAMFALAQQRAARSFYTQNAFIGYDMLEKMGIANGRSYMEAAFPDGSPLETAFAAPQLASQLDAAVEEAVRSGSWLDVQACLPSALSTADAASLLEQSPALQSAGKAGGAKLLAGTCIVSHTLLEALQLRSMALAREAADQALQKRRALAAAASTSAATAPTAGSKSTQKKVATADDDSDEDWDTGKGKKKKGAKRKSALRGKAPAAMPSKGNKARADADTEAVSSLSLEALTAKVEEWLPEAVGAGDSSDLTEALAADLRPAAFAEYEKALAAVFLAGAEARRRKRDGIAKALEEAYQRLQLYAHGAELASSDSATHVALQRHLLRSVGQPVFDLILRYQEVDLKDEQQAGSAADSQQHLQPFSATERTRLLSKLPADTAPTAVAADKALNGSDLVPALEALQRAAEAAGLQLRKLDKKAEKSLVQDHRNALEEKLKSQEDPAEALSLVVPLLVTQLHGRAMSVPGKALSGVIGLLQSELPPGPFQELGQFHSLVVDSLRSHSPEPAPKLAALLPKIKGVAGVGGSTQDAAEEGPATET